MLLRQSVCLGFIAVNWSKEMNFIQTFKMHNNWGENNNRVITMGKKPRLTASGHKGAVISFETTCFVRYKKKKIQCKGSKWFTFFGNMSHVCFFALSNSVKANSGRLVNRVQYAELYSGSWKYFYTLGTVDKKCS